MIPTIALMLNPIKDQLWMFTVPFLSQNQMILRLVRSETILGIEWATYLGAGFGLGALLWLIAARWYHRENLAFPPDFCRSAARWVRRACVSRGAPAPALRRHSCKHAGRKEATLQTLAGDDGHPAGQRTAHCQQPAGNRRDRRCRTPTHRPKRPAMMSQARPKRRL